MAVKTRWWIKKDNDDKAQIRLLCIRVMSHHGWETNQPSQAVHFAASDFLATHATILSIAHADIYLYDLVS